VAGDLTDAIAAYRAAQQVIADAKAQLRAGQAQLRTARGDLAEQVVAAYRNGTRVSDLAEATGLSREWVRQTLRAAGVTEPDWPDWYRR
jgi:septal ring factor EnvC (AmiA/AmiB activator)